MPHATSSDATGSAICFCLSILTGGNQLNCARPCLLWSESLWARARALSLSRCVCGCTPPSAAPCPPLATAHPTGKLTQRQHLPLLQSGSIFWGAGGRREAGRDWGPDSAAAPAPAPAAAAGLCPLFNPLHASLCTNKAAHFNLAANYERQQQQQQQNYR